MRQRRLAFLLVTICLAVKAKASQPVVVTNDVRISTQQAVISYNLPTTSGGLLIYSTVTAASNNAANIKSSAGQVYGITAFNVNATPRYVKLFNVSGTPVCGSTVPVTRFMLPSNSTSGAGFSVFIPSGIAFGTGIGICVTTGIADTDNTSPSANDALVNVFYK